MSFEGRISHSPRDSKEVDQEQPREVEVEQAVADVREETPEDPRKISQEIIEYVDRLCEEAPSCHCDQKFDRYFAMLHCDVMLNETSWEGGCRLEAFLYWKGLIEATNFSGIDKHCLLSPIDDLIEFDQLMDPITSMNFDEHIETIMRAIAEKCERPQACCFLPSGWNTRLSGHLAILKICRHNDRYICSVLNRGSGIAFGHRSVVSGQKIKYDYESQKYVIDFNTTLGRHFLRTVILLKKPDKKQGASIKPFSSVDLYGTLKLCGEQLPSEDFQDERMVEATPHRSGSCV